MAGGGVLGADRSGPRQGARGRVFRGFIGDGTVHMIRPELGEGTDGGQARRVAADGPGANP